MIVTPKVVEAGACDQLGDMVAMIAACEDWERSVTGGQTFGFCDYLYAELSYLNGQCPDEMANTPTPPPEPPCPFDDPIACL